MAPSYPDLTEPGETVISTFSPPTDEPWARGLLEGGFQRQLQKFGARFNGKYNKRNRRTIKKAIEKPEKLPTTTLYENDLRAYLRNLGEMPRPRRVRGENQPQVSRAAAYSAYVNPRPCPPVRRLFHLPLNKHEDWVELDGFGFNFAKGGEDHFIPIVDTVDELPDLYIRWMNAILAERKVHLYAIELEIGWVGEICLEDTWYAIAPRSEYPFTHFDDDRQFDIAIARLKELAEELEETTLTDFLKHFGALPIRLNTTYSGRYVRPESLPDQQRHEQVKEAAPSKMPAPARSRPTQAQQPEKPASAIEVDWSDLF